MPDRPSPPRVGVYVLGPLEVRASGRTLRLPPFVRALAAVLAAHAGRSMSVDRLADVLWDGRPPPSFRNRVQAAISTLRRALSAAGVGEPIVLTVPSGYALDGDRAVVDAVQFGALVATAREQIATGALLVAINTYRTGLALWRGEAFEDVAGPGTEAEAARLGELRLSAVEECLEAELAIGGHADAVVELTRLVAQHPLRERLRSQLMLGLYRSGREAEALAVYRSGYDKMTAELGVEPGATLQGLHHAILTRQPQLIGSAGPLPATAGQADEVPNQLPLAVADFTGRLAELRALHDRLVTRVAGSNAASVVMIAGMGGVGKSALAIRAGRQAAAVFPGGCLFTDLRGTTGDPVDPHHVLGSFLRALGVSPQRVPPDPAERLALYRTITATRRILVVLDDAAAETQVRPLIPAGDGCGVIVTARSLLLGLEGSAWIQLEALPDHEAVDILATVAGREKVTDSALAERVVRLCGGLPLAVRIAAARLAGQRLLTLSQVAHALGEEDGRLDVLTAGDRSVRACLSLSYSPLDADAARLLRLLGIVPGADLTARVCAVVLDRPQVEASRILDRLLVAQLAAVSDTRRHEARYRLHDLVRLFAAERAAEQDPEGVRDGALDRLLDHYIDTAYAAGRLLTSGRHEHVVEHEVKPAEPLRFPNDAEAIDWFEGEKVNLRSAVTAAANRGDHSRAWQLAHGLRGFYRRRFELDDWLATHQVALAAAQALDDPLAVVRVRESLGSAYLEMNRAADARDQWTTTLAMRKEIGDEIGQGRSHDSLGAAYGRLGQVELAISHHRAAMAIPAYAAHPLYAAWSELSLGAKLGRIGQYGKACKAFRRALRAARELGDVELICFAEHNLAEVFLLNGDRVTAQAHAQAEIDIAQRAQYAIREARGWDILGQCLIDVDQTQACSAWRHALELYESMGNQFADSVRARLASATGS